MKLKTTQWIAISACILLVVGIYLFADTKKPIAPKPEGPMAVRDTEGQKQEEPSFDWEGYMGKVKANITNQDTLKLIEGWEKNNSEDNLKSLISLYHRRGESVAEAHYTLQLGLVKKGDLLVRAGDLFSATSAISSDEGLKHYLMDQSVESYKNAVQQDSSVANRLKLASAYMDQGTAPMQGVAILLDVVNKDPNNADAQFLLGKFGIVSRQFDKAIVRLEKVVSLRPQNYDAVFLLAVAYSGKGDNKKAIGLLDKCSKMVDKPELKQKIEEYKKSLSKGS
jgi:tetratricopeptide (TPR) repeat protein